MTKLSFSQNAIAIRSGFSRIEWPHDIRVVKEDVLKILIVEDEKKTGEYLTKGLTEAGFVVDLADNGLNGYHLAMTDDYDLLILDIMLPDVNGWDIVRMLRAANKGMPILLLTALGTIEHRVKGLELGADDYLTKPFYLEELKMRIQALLKRSGKFNENTLTYGNIVVNLSTNTVKVEDTPVELLGKEFDLLVYFLQNQNVILPKTQIFDRLWGFDSDTTISVVEVYVSKVRKKLKGTTFAENLQTLRSVGYILKDVQ